MPAFTFEKISPPTRRAPATTPEKPKGILSQMIDRFAEKRARRVVRAERTPRADDKAE